ncbi:MAG: hypothetical protein AAF511_07550, partial [Pseudomonadota bacterium]
MTSLRSQHVVRSVAGLGEQMAIKRAEFRDGMTLFSTVSFVLGGAMLWITGNDPGSLVDAAYTILRDDLQLGQDATWNDILNTARDNVVELALAGGATLSSGLAVLWSRIRV